MDYVTIGAVALIGALLLSLGALAVVFIRLSKTQIVTRENTVKLDVALQLNTELTAENQKLRADVLEKAELVAAKDQQLRDMEQNYIRLNAERDKDREQFLNSAKQSVFEAAQTISTKLINDHKQETKENRELTEKTVKQTSAALLESVTTLSHKMASLDKDYDQTKATVGTLQAALSSPGMAGQTSQIALGNMLQRIGLKEGQDFLLEHSVTSLEGQRLRPDAIIRLPNNMALVVDSKASKYLWDMTEAGQSESKADYEQAQKNFLSAMNQHVHDLNRKDYRVHVEQGLNALKIDESQKIHTFPTLMWLPTEGALERLEQADPNFVENAASKGVFPVATNGLWAAIAIAGSSIHLQQREENLYAIIDEVNILINRIGTTLGHAEKLGKSLKSSAETYNKFAGSLNTYILSQSNKLVKLGVSPPTKELRRLPSIGDAQPIDAIGESVDEVPTLPHLSVETENQ